MRLRELTLLAILITYGLGFTAAVCRAASPYPYRLVWAWGGIDHSEQIDPANSSFFQKSDMLHPDQVSHYVELAKQLQSMKVNGLVISIGLHAPKAFNALPQIKAFSEFLHSYGIGLYFYIPYASAQYGSSNCPYNPAFIRYWNRLADALFTQVPLLKGYVIKGTGYEQIPGPLDCECSNCKKKNEPQRMLAALEVLSSSVQKHKGVVFYRTWMTGALQDREYKLFSELSSKLPRNIYLVSKIGYGDFGIKEIPHPLFGNIKPASQHIAEFQIFGEYRGRRYNPCEMATHWGNWMRINKDSVGGMIGVVVLDRKRADHPLNMVNWYAFGRYAYDPDASPDEIITSWAEKTYGKKAAPIVAEVVKRTSIATLKRTYFKGVWIQRHSWLPTPKYLDSRLRGPWVDMKREENLIGWGKSLEFFAPEKAALYAKDPDFELFINRKPITPHILKQLAEQQDEAIKEHERMLLEWRKTKTLIPEAKYKHVERLLEANLDDAKIWRLNTLAYIKWLQGKDNTALLDKMARQAKLKKGTILVQQEIKEVLKAYKSKSYKKDKNQ